MSSILPARFTKTYATVDADLDLLAVGLATGGVKEPARGFVCSGAGNLVLKYLKVDGSGSVNDTIPMAANVIYPYAAIGVVDSGTTVTGLTVIW